MIPALLVAATLTAVAPQEVRSADVASIVQSRCVSCHQPGGDAPFSLATIDDLRARAKTIVAVTKSRYMPPWKPVEGDFVGSRRLTDREIETIERWVNTGMLGESAFAPSGLRRDRLGSPSMPDPDLEINLPAYTLRADGPDVFRNFVVRVPDGATRWVRAMQFRPGNRAVHHANIRVDATPASRRLDDEDPAPGYEGIIARSADFPDGQFLGWTPGQLAPAPSDESAWRLRGGTDLVVQLHLRPSGAIEHIAPVIDLYFGDRAPSRTPVMIRLGKQDLDIPAGTTGYISDSFVLPVAAGVLAIQPHAHHRARSVEATATLPDGSRRSLIRIDDWDMNWQDRYVYAAPVRLPAGTRLSMTYTFDNSIANPRNPDRPPVRARWGWRSSDEMADVWLQVTANSDDDREQLAREISRRMLYEDANGIAVLLEREPDHVNLRNDAARIEMALGRPDKALPHFEHVRKLQPASAAAWFNEGTALEGMGRARWSDAAARYAEALRLDPNYSPALNNSGIASLKAGRIDDARLAFERAVKADATNADARANLGLTLIAAARSDEGLAHIREAIDRKPELLGGLTSHVLLLAAHHDPSARRPAEALALAQRVAAVSADRAGALDALAVSQAATGDFTAAVQTAGAALAAAPAGNSELRDAIRERIALYRNQQPFVLKQ
ncbi:MAG: tetratricopeptide repeat protein [Cyanobacteria bacterium]|nr:tetratricopeptide repeat protein [Cyanobacteriota bacterium]